MAASTATPGTNRRTPAFLALAALVVRVGWLLALGPSQISWDGAEYARSAYNLVHGAGYVGMHGTITSIFPPLYSLAIAALMMLRVDGETAGIAVSILAGAALVFPVYAIAARLYGARAGLAAGAIIAFLPIAVDLSVLVLSDSLFALLAASGLAVLIRTLDDGRPRTALIAGFLFGLAYLTRPEGLVLGLACTLAFAGAYALLPALRPRIAGCAAAYVFALCVTAAPYAAFISSRAHGFALEGKSAINATIAERMRSGLSYVQAADAVDANLDIIGPELDDDEYLADRWVRHPSLNERISLVVSDARRRIVDVPRTMLTKPFGTPLLALAAIVGLLAGPWTRRRAVAEIAIAGYIVALFLSLTTVYHFWPRYAFGFTPVLAVWAGHGLDVIARRLRLRAPAPAAVAAIALVFVALLAAMPAWYRDEVNDASPLTERAAGNWMAAHDSAPGRILAVSDQSVYYAHGTWSMLPYVPRTDLALAYVRLKAPRYLVLDRYETDERPYVATWLADGIPDPHAQLVHVIGDPRHPDAEIYRWSASAPTASDAAGPAAL
jgi:4-amino-4-deoxy-L-arabinose transferase-like glycosyltransferase